MRNFVQAGNTLTINAPAATLSGDVVTIGEIVGIAAGSAATGDRLDVDVTGVFRLAKVAADDVALGDAVFYDSTAGLVTLEVTDTTRIGVAVAAAGASTGDVLVRLSGF